MKKNIILIILLILLITPNLIATTTEEKTKGFFIPVTNEKTTMQTFWTDNISQSDLYIYTENSLFGCPNGHCQQKIFIKNKTNEKTKENLYFYFTAPIDNITIFKNNLTEIINDEFNKDKNETSQIINYVENKIKYKEIEEIKGTIKTINEKNFKYFFSIPLSISENEEQEYIINYTTSVNGEYAIFYNNNTYIDPTYNFLEVMDLGSNNIRFIIEYDGNIWLGGNDGVVYTSDGTNYAISTVLDTDAQCAEIYNNKLYVGGGDTINVFNGSSWSESYNHGGSQTPSLITYGGNLYAGTGSLGKVYKYNGTIWSMNYDSREEYIFGLEVYDGNMWATSGNLYGDIYTFDGTNWTNTGFSTGTIKNVSLEVFDGNLWVGGRFSDIYTTDGVTFTKSYDDDADAEVHALYNYNDEFLISGTFSTIGRVIIYTPSDWTINQELGMRIDSIGSMGDTIYIGLAGGYIYSYTFTEPPDMNVSNLNAEYDLSNVNTIEIELKITDTDSNSFLIDLNYSDVNTLGTGNIIGTDLNSDLDFLCSGNFFEVATCVYEWDISDINTGQYYILAHIEDAEGGENNNQSNLFEIIDTTEPPPIQPETSETEYNQQYINPNQPIRDGNRYYADNLLLSDDEKQIKLLEQIGNLIIIGIVIIIVVGAVVWIKK